MRKPHHQQETPMFRKILLASAALAVIGTAAFTTTIPVASAQGFNHYRQNVFDQHRHNEWRPAVRFHNPHFGYRNCYVQRVIHTPFGPRVHTVNICY
jgi:hypothetical protein